MRTPTIADQVECARRELTLRHSCYPKWVSSGRMSQRQAEHELACMAEIVRTLSGLLKAQISEAKPEEEKP